MTLPLVEAAMEDLRHAHRDLLRVVDSLRDADWERYVPYGEWTVKDLIAHTIGDMSPSGAGLILAGVLTPQFIADTARTFDVRARNASLVDERRGLAREDLRQMLFSCHDAMHNAALKLTEEHLPILAYGVPMGPGYDLRVEDWLWHGYHDRQHADDIRRALEVDWRPEPLTFVPEIEGKMRTQTRAHEGLLRAAYSLADDAWGAQSEAAPGWTYDDILAHVASNEIRRETRLRSALGEASRAELDAINDVDAWNEVSVKARRSRTMLELIDEYNAGWAAILKTLSRFRPEHLAREVTLGGGQSVPATEFIDRMAAHTLRHAGQLVPASRARRWKSQ